MIRSDRTPALDPARQANADARAVPPVWVPELLGATPSVRSTDRVQILESAHFLLASIRVAGATTVDGAALESAAAEAYGALAMALSGPARWSPVRIWNFVPRILADGGDGLNRYMRFNAGRFRAFATWFGGAEGFDRALPAASAVGHGGSDLVVHALASREPGVAIPNPRQIPPHRYSKRFGPTPPCFARATRVIALGGKPHLLVGGTASIRGEESVFVGDLRRQLTETLDNLAAVVTTGFGPIERPLERYRSLRVYIVREADVAEIHGALASAMPRVERIEWIPAELCRGDLLVEIEGLAEAP